MPSAVKNDLPLTAWLSSNLVRPINLFQLYRLFLAVILLFLFISRSGPVWLGMVYPWIFALTALGYLGLIIVNIFLYRVDILERDNNIYLIVFTDIVVITLLMHASGGIQTGLGILLAISITAGSLLMKGRLALLFASLATMAVIAEQFSIFFTNYPVSPDFVHAALLGLAFFAIALLSHSLNLHIKASEQIARQTRRDLDSMAQLNEFVIGQIKQGVIAVDNHGQIKLINKAARSMLNLNSSYTDSSIQSICPKLAEKIHLQQSGKQSQFYPSLEINQESSEPSISYKVSLIPLGAATPEGTLAFIEDMSDIREQAQQLKLAALGRLTASIAHEIRNPLGAISHAGQLLSESESLPDADQRLTEIINQNAARLNQTIENVLKLSKRDNAQPEDVPIKPWLSDMRTQILQADNLQPRQISIEVSPAEATEHFDPGQMAQVLSILASNAITHFQKPIDQLSMTLAYSQSGSRNSLSCIDNGPGIHGENQSQIFEPFFTSRANGTGLGLYIAKELTESNQAQIIYNTLESGGSKFTVYFSKYTKSDDS